MKRFLVIECDTAYLTVLVHEVTQEFTADDDPGRGVAYHRGPSESSLICDGLGSKFYGKLDALLVTRDRIEDAMPIEPEPPAPKVHPEPEDILETPAHVADFLAAPITEGP